MINYIELQFMKKFFLRFLFVFLCFHSPANAQELSRKWGEWMMTYHTEKSSDRVGLFLQAYSITDAMLKNDMTTEKRIISVFLAHLFKNNHDKLAGWLDKDYPEIFKDYLFYTLIIADLKDKAPESYKDIAKRYAYLDVKPIDFEKISPIDVENMDLLWSSFFATGETKYITQLTNIFDPKFNPAIKDLDHNIVLYSDPNTLKDIKNYDNDTIMRYLNLITASWSIKANMMHHEKVKQHIDKLRKETKSDSIKKYLDAIAEEARIAKKPQEKSKKD